MNAENIDIVIIWVDGNDPNWIKEKQKYDVKTNADASVQRYRDWDLLKYWFRGVEKFAPWVNKIHFVTWGHLPSWLDTSNPKLNIVNHSDFIPKKYLPTFNARTIDLNLHRIKGLNENFIFFNDDFYLIDYVKKEDFFVNGIPKDTVALNTHCPTKGNTGQFACFNNVAIINSHFQMKECLKRDWKKWYNLKNGKPLLRTFALRFCPRFPGFYQHHLAVSYNKKTFMEVWEKEYDILDQTCQHKFRETTDVNDWIFKEWQIAQGNFQIRSNNFGKAFFVDRDGISSIREKMVKYIKNQKGKIIAINDGPMSEQEFEDVKKTLADAFNYILDEKSSFEK